MRVDVSGGGGVKRSGVGRWERCDPIKWIRTPACSDFFIAGPVFIVFIIYVLVISKKWHL